MPRTSTGQSCLCVGSRRTKDILNEPGGSKDLWRLETWLSYERVGYAYQVKTGGPDVVEDVQKLHAAVDDAVASVVRHHIGQLNCGPGCSGCCIDELTVFEVEAERIRRHHPKLLRDGSPAPHGRCAFLDPEGCCQVYEDRPYVCRTQGLPLRWIEDDTEERVICELNEESVALVSLPSEHCFELGPFEAELATLQARHQGARMGSAALSRVPLRSLFERAED